MTASPYAAALERIPVHRRTVEVLGSSAAWWEYGTPGEPVIVLVHGFRGDHHGLEPVVAQLRGFRVVSPDLPGFGESDPLRGRSHDIDGYAQWLAAFLDAVGLGAGASFTLLGHSFGSIVASAAVASGLRPDRLILVNPIGAPALEGPRGIMTRLAVGYYRSAAALPSRAGFALLRNGLIVRVMSTTMAKTRDADLRRFIHDQHDRYFSVFADRDMLLEAFRASVGNDVRQYASDIPVPTLLVAAVQDDITPIEAQRALVGRFADARLVEIDGVGHLIHYEKPVEAAEHIRGFLGADAEATGATA
ncbi:alpha/beta fold hydrolase [Agromyces sp. CFH 90414]|uniref:Alpha/beta fold hydrolase n=1 Tax=Agromyces agglutinans TaxID=2662258 RepID=A0A6I2F1Z2_9MICO|nr:alpha/beta hydrolase [Agromyces agglutinans]MRG58444.1 alpha/beta fold hydrolase [Agromyces agglutinans]